MKQNAPKTAMEKRALETAEVALEASGLRYQSGQIPGLAHILMVFAESEIRRREAFAPLPPQPPMTGWECPKCGHCYSPLVSQCESCGPTRGSWSTYGTGPACTCGTSAVCPTHQPKIPYTTTCSPGTPEGAP